jgi:hypothetical protein
MHFMSLLALGFPINACQLAPGWHRCLAFRVYPGYIQGKFRVLIKGGFGFGKLGR